MKYHVSHYNYSYWNKGIQNFSWNKTRIGADAWEMQR